MSESYKDTLYTINKQGKRQWVYPHLVKGKFFYRRSCVAYFLVAFYLLLPWVTINGQQAVLLDIAGRQFTFFGVTLWATDTIFLVFVFLGLALSLFFFTSLFGRVWCGWACPETVFLEFVFRPIERLIEGGPVQRKKLDQQPWNIEKIRKKLLMHTVRAVMAWILASTALAYFIGREPLLEMMSQSPANNLSLFLTTFVLMGLMAFQFGWFREQFCTILCPYARFQSVLLDKNSLVVGYDVNRGEPRGKLNSKEETGDCIDCGLCVRVCPTGIDIRNGLQLECINCTACIDACNSVMKKIQRPLGLIRYDSEAVLLDRVARKFSIRPLIYALILCVIAGIFGYLFLNRNLTDFQVLRGGLDKPYTMIDTGTVNNHLHLRITNKSGEAKAYHVQVSPDDIQSLTPLPVFTVAAGQLQTYPLFLTFKKGTLSAGKREAEIKLLAADSLIATQKFTLLGPHD